MLTTRAGSPEGLRVDRTLDLSPLSAVDAAALLRNIAPDLPEPAVTARYAETAGNPYILTRLARTVIANLDGPVPTLASALSEALAELPADGEEAALLLALAGRPLELDLMAAAGVRRRVTLELERRGITTRSVDSHYRFELQHDRLATTLLAGATAVRQSRGHAILATTLIDRGRADDTPHIATHLHASEHPDAPLWAGRAGERFALGCLRPWAVGGGRGVKIHAEGAEGHRRRRGL